MYITYDDMPPSAQKTYDLNNKLRKITMMMGWVLSPVIFLIIMVYSLISGDGFGVSFVLGIEMGMTLGCLLNGFLHSTSILRPALHWLKDKMLGLGILFGLFALIPILLIAIGIPYICAVFGWIFVIVDTILYLKKKPLIYRWEHKQFIKMKKAQEEIEAAAYMEAAEAAKSETAAEKLSSLNKLREQGAITEDEYNAKKAELMDQI